MKKLILVVILIALVLAIFGWNYFFVNKTLPEQTKSFYSQMKQLNELNASVGLEEKPLHWQIDALFELSFSQLNSLKSSVSSYSKSLENKKLKDLASIYLTLIDEIIAIKEAKELLDSGKISVSCEHINDLKSFNSKLNKTTSLASQLKEKIDSFISKYANESKEIELYSFVESPTPKIVSGEFQNVIVYLEEECG